MVPITHCKCMSNIYHTQRASFWQLGVQQGNLNTLLSRQHVVCLTQAA